MNTRVTTTAKLHVACRQELRQQLRLSVDPVSELNRLSSIVASHQLTAADLTLLISTVSASSVLSTLAPAEFSRVLAHMARGSRSALETTVADLQAELAETLAVATSVVTAATRDITGDSFAASGRELGYTVTTHHADTATCVELRREQESVLVAVHNGGEVEFVHSKLAGYACRQRQQQLERAAGRHGVFVRPAVPGTADVRRLRLGA